MRSKRIELSHAEFQKKVWNEVSLEMNEPVEGLKKTWKGLRGTFQKEFQKLKSGNGGDASQVPKWPFFNQLLFFANTVKPRNMESSVPPVEEDVTEEDTTNEKSTIEDHAATLSTSQHSDLSTCATQGENVGDSRQQIHVTSATKKLFKSPQKIENLQT